MAKKKFFLTIDTETTQTGMVADFGAVVTDLKGNIHHSIGVLVSDFYLKRDEHPLFYTRDASPLWGIANLPKRYANYDAMLDNGSRILASVPAINRWLAKVAATYNPVLTAYNLPFDQDKMTKSGIDHMLFPKRFCLWHAASSKWGHTKAFRQHVLDAVAFNPPTKFKNMSYITNAEVMARFVLGNPELEDEPHTALEDIVDYELPILNALVKSTKAKEYMNPTPYNWRDYQVKDWFTVK
jgi:hypothetical protein